MARTEVSGSQIKDASVALSAAASPTGAADVTGVLPVANGGTGATTLTGLVKGNGGAAMTAAVAGTDYATPNGPETLTNKTLYEPTVTSAGPQVLGLNRSGDAFLAVENGGAKVIIGATGGDAFVGTQTGTTLNFRTGNVTRASLTTAGNFNTVGTITANNVPVVTTTGAQTLTGKTISGDSNTFSNLSPTSVAGLTSNWSRLVCETAAGGIAADNGANTWAKIATVSTGSTQFADYSLVLCFVNASAAVPDTAIISAQFRSNGTGQNPSVDVSIVAKGGGGGVIAADSFKIISNGWASDMELWVKKAATYGGFSVYELARRSSAGPALVYATSSPWQAATPTGTAINVVSNGVTAFGIPVELTSRKGVANGYASLDSGGKVPISQIPDGLGGGGGVTSVNGQVGIVNLHIEDIGIPNPDDNGQLLTYMAGGQDIEWVNPVDLLTKADVGLENVDNTSDATKNAATATLSNKTLRNYTESVVVIGTVGAASTLSLTNGTMLTATLTASTATTFTMPAAVAGKSFKLMLRQAAVTGNGTAAFTNVKWAGTTPVATATAGRLDIFSFVSDGTNWYGSATRGYTP